jgi:hypothetical protein
MIFEEKNIVELSLEPSNGQDTIAYPIGDDNNRAYAFMAIVHFYLEERISLIYVGITEGEINNQTTIDIRDKFYRTDFKRVQSLTENQKLGLEPIAENIFSTEDPVAAYNRFQDVIFQYEQTKYVGGSIDVHIKKEANSILDVCFCFTL